MAGQGKAESAYQELERMITFQKLPPGSLVSESMLTEMTGFGRTPVREALQRLAREGMVQIHPNKGVLIPAASLEAQLRLLELRRELESLAVQLACKRARQQQRAAMAEMVRRLTEETFTLREYLDTVTATHHMIAEAADNDFLADAMAPLQGLSRRFWVAHVTNADNEITKGAQLHRRILTAILTSNEADAKSASHALNNYLVAFAYATVGAHGPQGADPARV